MACEYTQPLKPLQSTDQAGNFCKLLDLDVSQLEVLARNPGECRKYLELNTNELSEMEFSCLVCAAITTKQAIMDYMTQQMGKNAEVNGPISPKSGSSIPKNITRSSQATERSTSPLSTEMETLKLQRRNTPQPMSIQEGYHIITDLMVSVGPLGDAYQFGEWFLGLCNILYVTGYAVKYNLYENEEFVPTCITHPDLSPVLEHQVVCILRLKCLPPDFFVKYRPWVNLTDFWQAKKIDEFFKGVFKVLHGM